jgi:putative membrane protein
MTSDTPRPPEEPSPPRNLPAAPEGPSLPPHHLPAGSPPDEPPSPPRHLPADSAPEGPSFPPRRLHPAAVVAGAAESMREVAMAVVVGVVLQAGSGGLGSGWALGLALLGALVALVVGWLRWVNEWYAVADGAIRHHRGIISADETTVPITRIQAIDTSQGPIQRLFGVYAVHVQTAGGGAKGEIELRALSVDAVASLRAAAGLEQPVARTLPQWRLGRRRLLATSLTAPQFGVVLPLVGAVAAGLDNVLSGDTVRNLVDRSPDDAAGVELLLAAVLAIGWLISFVGAFVAYAGFRVTRDEQRLRIERGLLQRRSASVAIRRVQAVDVVEGTLRRPFGLAAVRIEIAGYRSEPAVAQTLFPLVRLAEVDDLLRAYVPHLAGALGPLQQPPRRARRRYVLPPLAVGVAVGIGAAVAWPAGWPLALVLAALGGAAGLARFVAAGWRLTADAIVLRRRRWSPARSTLVAGTGRLQEEELTQNPFQRRARLADLSVAVGSGKRGRVAQLELATAEQLFVRLRSVSS